MKVYVNGKEVHLSPGMTVKHALTQAGLSDVLDAGEKDLRRMGKRTGVGWRPPGRGESFY